MAEPLAKKGRKPVRLSGILVADDLTGACDAALAVSKSGLKVTVLPNTFDGNFEDDGSTVQELVQCLQTRLDSVLISNCAEVVVVNNNSRLLAASRKNAYLARFYEVLRQFATSAKELSGTSHALPVYLKVDSTVRGNIGQDLERAMTELDLKKCVFAPALPEAGRTTVGGVQLLHGLKQFPGNSSRDKGLLVPVAIALKKQFPGTAEPAAAESLPAKSSLRALLRHGGFFSACALEEIHVDDIEAGDSELPRAIQCTVFSPNESTSVLLADAVDQEHLQCLAAAISQECRKAPALPLLAGSAGLAAELRTAWSIDISHEEQGEVALNSGSMLFVIGSDTSTCTTQLQRLRSKVPESDVIEVKVSERTDVQSVLPDLATSPALPRVIILSCFGQEAKAEAVTNVCHIAKKVMNQLGKQLAGIVVSGGYTLCRLLSTCLNGSEISHLEVVGEVGQCTPVLRVVGGPLDNCALVTKGGRLGEEDVFVKALEYFPCPEKGASSQLPSMSLDTDLSQSTLGSKPVLALTMGDVAGIGPEIMAKLLRLPEVWKLCRPVVIGSAEALKVAAGLTKSTVEPIKIADIADINWPDIFASVTPDREDFVSCSVPVLTNTVCDYDSIDLGKVSSHAGHCAAQWVIHAVELCMNKQAAAIVTAPLNKESMNKGGHRYAGHTELLAQHSGARTSRLMLASEKLKVVHATGHCSLADVPTKLTVNRLADTIRMSGKFLRDQGMAKPRVAIAGLNPHAGDGGLFGNEEATVLAPAIEQCRSEGWIVSDPIPSDTLFCRTLKGEFDIVVAMYHDQGHIPAKLVDFGSTVNVTLGLPIIRTSVDHGTAFDIAGKGIADETNLLHALRLAAKMAAKH